MWSCSRQSKYRPRFGVCVFMCLSCTSSQWISVWRMRVNRWCSSKPEWMTLTAWVVVRRLKHPQADTPAVLLSHPQDSQLWDGQSRCQSQVLVENGTTPHQVGCVSHDLLFIPFLSVSHVIFYCFSNFSSQSALFTVYSAPICPFLLLLDYNLIPHCLSLFLHPPPSLTFVLYLFFSLWRFWATVFCLMAR